MLGDIRQGHGAVSARESFISIDGLATVADALEQMSEQSARFLIVNKRSDDDEFGMVLVSEVLLVRFPD